MLSHRRLACSRWSSCLASSLEAPAVRNSGGALSADGAGRAGPVAVGIVGRTAGLGRGSDQGQRQGEGGGHCRRDQEGLHRSSPVWFNRRTREDRKSTL